VYVLNTMSEDEEIKVDIDDDDDGDDELEPPLEEGATTQPIEVIREEIVTVVNPDRETSSVSVSPLVEEEEDEEEEEEEETDMDTSDNENIYEQLKAQSIQISKLTDIVESLQSQIKQLQEKRYDRPRTTPARKKTIQTKKKAIEKRTKRRKRE
jgi:hypothetical protein